MNLNTHVIFPVLFLAVAACRPRVENSVVKDGGGTGHSTAPLYNVQDNWPDACKTGTRQSPIALSTSHIAQVARSSNLKFNMAPVDTKVIDDGHSIKVSVKSGLSSLTLDTVDYDLIQFHFHETSEHSLNNEVFDGEMHFVHKERNGNGLLALGLLLTESKIAQSGLEHFFSKLPLGQHHGKVGLGSDHSEYELLSSLSVDPSNIIKSGLNYIVYEGSLTTPPCSETVIHLVATEPLAISAKSLEKLRSYHHRTNRKIQNLNSNKIRDFRTTRR